LTFYSACVIRAHQQQQQQQQHWQQSQALSDLQALHITLSASTAHFRFK
jgi:hypothetical protein